LLNKIIHFFF
jgi:hypothetical protein